MKLRNSESDLSRDTDWPRNRSPGPRSPSGGERPPLRGHGSPSEHAWPGLSGRAPPLERETIGRASKLLTPPVPGRRPRVRRCGGGRPTVNSEGPRPRSDLERPATARSRRQHMSADERFCRFYITPSRRIAPASRIFLAVPLWVAVFMR